MTHLLLEKVVPELKLNGLKKTFHVLRNITIAVMCGSYSGMILGSSLEYWGVMSCK